MDTTVSTPQAVATVIAVEGQAYARDPAGQMRPLKAGDVLREGDTVVTLAGGQVQLAFLDGQMLTVLPDESFLFSAETAPGTRPEAAESALAAGEAERIIQALERGEDIDAQLDETAAGLSGGGNNDGNSFVRLLRIVEGVAPLSFQFESRANEVEFRTQDSTFGTPPNTDNDIPTVSVAVAPASVAEDGAANLVYTFTLSNASDFDTTVNYALSGTAANGTDYTGSGLTGSLTIPAGSLTATLTIDPTADSVFESDETVIATITSATTNGQNVAVTGSPATGTITDDDGAPSFSVNNVTIGEGGLMTFTVTRTGDAQATQTVDFATSIGGSDTAEAADFLGNSGTLTFAAGVTSQTFTVQTTQDSVYEGPETFSVTLANATNGATIANATGTGTIVDDGTGTPPNTDNDIPTVSVAVAPASVAEDGAANLVYTFTLSNASDF
ncbi:MAG: retention module-containing protein, partial [Pseudomonadota bacterium]